MIRSKRARRPGWRQAFQDLRQDQEGGTAIEYSLVAVGIALAILLTVVHIGDQVAGMFAVAVAALG